jgi:hypothetical protein
METIEEKRKQVRFMVHEFGLGPAWENKDSCERYLVDYCKKWGRDITKFNIVRFTRDQIVEDLVTGILSIKQEEVS